MDKYLLDTTVIIDFSRGHQACVGWLSEILKAPENVFITPMAAYEYLKGTITKEEEDFYNTLCAVVKVVSPTSDDTVEAARIYKEYRKRGVTLAHIDVMQGAVARRRGLIIATSNEKYFPFCSTYNPRNYDKSQQYTT